MMKNNIIIDNDHIEMLYKKKWLPTYIKTKTELSKIILERNKNISTYILWAAGTWKSTFAMKNGGIYLDTLDQILSYLRLELPTIVINSNIPKEITAIRANQIYILEDNKSKIIDQRKQREINNDFTNFDRKNSTEYAPLDVSLCKSILKKNFPNKTYTVDLSKQNSEITPISLIYQNIKTPIISSIAQTSWKFSPPHIWHTNMMKSALLKQNTLNIMTSWAKWFSSQEIKFMISLALENENINFWPYSNYWNNSYLMIWENPIQIDFENSDCFLGKERLPEWFISWRSSDTIIQKFLEQNKRDISWPLLSMLKFGNFNRAEDFYYENKPFWSSDYRQMIINNSATSEIINQCFDPKISHILSNPNNIKIIRKRLINTAKEEEKVQKIAIQIKEKYQKKYIKKYWETDFLTNDGKIKNTFDFKTPKWDKKSEKIELIEKMKEDIKAKSNEVKEKSKNFAFDQLEWIDYNNFTKPVSEI